MIIGDRDFTYLAHILECIETIEKYILVGKKEFLENSLVSDAVLRRLQIMAKSTQRLSSELKAEVSLVDWRGLAGFRNVLVHDYLGGISLERVWDAIENDLPILKQEVIILLNS